MARVTFICERCGKESPQWHGKCPACGDWNTLVQIQAPSRSAPPARPACDRGAVLAAEVEAGRQPRLQVGIAEFDRVLGGGLVPGALVLVAGDPGIGKSTLLLQAAAGFAGRHGTCLYVSGEESVGQIAMRGERVRGEGDARGESGLLLLAQTEIEAIEAELRRTRPGLAVIDSIQALYSPEIESLPGSVSQVRGCATRLLRAAKELAVPILLVGHVTKEGAVAGPRLLEHMVDVVLSLEGDHHGGYRVLRSSKNRFGSSDELGLFQMTERGLEGVPDASAALLAERQAGAPGSCVAAAVEGSRPLLVEIQALVSRAAPYGSPRRSVTGVDYNRTCLILAVLEKRADLSLASEDVFVNVPGGVRVTEPAVDLGLALAIASSLKDRPVRPDTACVGEVGLTGEIRSVPRLERRLVELARRGFRRCLIPASASRARPCVPAGFSVVAVGNLAEAFPSAF